MDPHRARRRQGELRNKASRHVETVERFERELTGLIEDLLRQLRDPAEFAGRIRMKPVRTGSGVAPVSLLTKPYPCPGECIFCPGDTRMPKSYLSMEPGAQREDPSSSDFLDQEELLDGRALARSYNQVVSDYLRRQDDGELLHSGERCIFDDPAKHLTGAG